MDDRVYYLRTATQVIAATVWSSDPQWIGVRYRNTSGSEERTVVPRPQLYRACLTVLAGGRWQPTQFAAIGWPAIPGDRVAGQAMRRYPILTNDPATTLLQIQADPHLTPLSADETSAAPE